MTANSKLGEVFTYRKQEPVNKGFGYFDPEKVFFREDENGKVIIDGKRCLIVKSKDEANVVKIGDKFYKFVQIGDQVWLAENLDLPFTDATYYNDNPNESYGLLYIGTSVEALQEALYDTGWHIPTFEEYFELINIDGGAIRGSGGTAYNPNIGNALKSKTSWNNPTGTDKYGFDGKAGGMRVGGSYQYKGQYGVFWTCVPKDSSNQYRMTLDNGNNTAYSNGLGTGAKVSIRLIKDTTPVIIDGQTYKTAKIGGRIWTIENLNYKVPGIAYNPTGGGTTDPSCWSWNNGDTEVRPKGGMYYNAFAAKYINDNNLIPEWHAAYAGELAELNTYASGENAKLRNLSEWPSGTVSTNDYRFNAIPAGNRANTGAWANQTDYALITSCVIDGDNTYRLNINTNSTSTTFGTSNNRIGFSVRLVKDTEPVIIGGKTYKTQKIGNQLWMTENLDYIFEGLTLGGATLQDDIHAWYYDNDTNNALLYNGFAASYLAAHPELLPEGWRVPNNDDFSTLVGNFSSGTGGKMLKTNKNSFGGINYIGFNGDPAGIIRSNGSFTDKNNYLRIWSTTVSESNLQSFLSLENTKDNAPVLTFDNDRIVGYCIRLVKDFDVSTDVRKGGGDEPIEIKDDDYKDDEKPKEEQKK